MTNETDSRLFQKYEKYALGALSVGTFATVALTEMEQPELWRRLAYGVPKYTMTLGLGTCLILDSFREPGLRSRPRVSDSLQFVAGGGLSLGSFAYFKGVADKRPLSIQQHSRLLFCSVPLASLLFTSVSLCWHALWSSVEP